MEQSHSKFSILIAGITWEVTLFKDHLYNQNSSTQRYKLFRQDTVRALKADYTIVAIPLCNSL